MSRPRGTRVLYLVRCEDFDTKPQPNRETADRVLTQIEQAGHCQNRHQVVAV